MDGARAETFATIPRRCEAEAKRTANIVHFVRFDKLLAGVSEGLTGPLEDRDDAFEVLRRQLCRAPIDEDRDGYRVIAVPQERLWRGGGRAEFEPALGGEVPPPDHAAAHGGRYAVPSELLPVGALWDSKSRLAMCGDWCQGARIEGAFLSGWAAADRMLRACGAAADAAWLPCAWT